MGVWVRGSSKVAGSGERSGAVGRNPAAAEDKPWLASRRKALISRPIFAGEFLANYSCLHKLIIEADRDTRSITTTDTLSLQDCVPRFGKKPKPVCQGGCAHLAGPFPIL